MTEIVVATLTPADVAALNGYEVIISRGLDAFAAAGRAMLAINEQKLYRQTHATFADYCQDRWGMSDRHVRRLMLAADIVTKMTEIGPMGPIPTTERQARELVGLEPAVAVEVMTIATRVTKVPTASDIRQVRQITIEQARPRPPAATTPPAVKAKRKPMSDTMRRAAFDLEKLAERFRRMEQDDRFGQFAPVLAANGWFNRAVDDLVRIRDLARDADV